MANPPSMGSRARSWRSALLAAGFLLVVTGLLVSARPATTLAAKSVTWQSYDVTVDLLQDGSYHITERQQIAFIGGTFTGAYAQLPLQRTEGIDNIAVSEVTDTGQTIDYEFVRGSAYDEAPNTFTTKQTSSYIEVDYGFPPAFNEVRTFVLSYDVHGAMRVYGTGADTFQQIWWTAISNDVTDIAPVENATVTINLPAAVDTSKVLLGENADEDWHDHTSDGKTWTWTKQVLGSGDDFTVRLEFPALVNATAPAWQAQDDAQRLEQQKNNDRKALYNVIFFAIGLLTAALGGIGLYALWYLRGRDPHVGLVAEFLPAPPDDLPPGAVGTLVDEEVDERDIVATLVDLGRRGIITIEEKNDGGLFGGSDFVLTLKQAQPAVTDYELTLLKSLFGGTLTEGATERMSDAKRRFASNTEKIRQQMYAEVVKRGYFVSSPAETRQRWTSRTWMALVALVVLLFLAGGAITSFAWAAIVPIVAIVIVLLALLRLARALPRKTQTGAEVAAKWRAFRRYLSDIDRYDKVAESKEIFDKYLPYAVAFGLEQSWVRRFAAVGASQPAWFGPMVVTGSPNWAGGGRPHRGSWGGGWIMPGGGGTTFGGTPSAGGGGGVDLPNLQDMSNQAGRSIQGGSNSFFDMLGAAARAFSDMSSSSGGGGGGRSWGGGGGGFHGGGGHGGSSGGGGRGFH